MQLIQPLKQSHPLKPAAGKRLLLVDPYPRDSQYHLTASERRAVWFPKLSLPTIAAYTPDYWDIDLVDEAVEDIDFDAPCDMVGLSIMTCYAPRAYEIAKEFRKRGKIVVMGVFIPPTVRTKPCSTRMRSSVVKPKICGRNWSPTTKLARCNGCTR